MTLSIRAKQEALIQKEHSCEHTSKKSRFFSYCSTGCIKKITKYLNLNPELIDLKNEENETVLEVLVRCKHETVLNHLLTWNGGKISSLVKSMPSLLFLALESDLVEFVERLTNVDSDLSNVKNETKENLFFSSCKRLNLRLMQHFYHLNPALIQTKNSNNQTPFLCLAESKRVGRLCFTWLLNHTTYQIRSQEEALAFYNLFSDRCLEETLLLKVLNFESLSYFLPFIKGFQKVVKSARVQEHMQDLLKPYPEDFFYEPQGEEVFEGDELIQFCTARIPEELSVRNPFKALHSLFFGIKKVDYVAQMAIGSERISRRAVNTQKKQDLQECKSLFSKIKNESEFRKKYLVKILKHLVVHLQKPESLHERLIFLNDLTAAAPHCYTHYSTIIRSIYSRISQDEVFSATQVKSDSQATMFDNSLRIFLKQAFCKKLREIHGTMNIHCQYLVQKFLREENYPISEAPIFDEDHYLMATLILFRQEKLGIAFENEDTAIIQQDQLLYEDTKRLYFEFLKENLLHLDFLFNNTLDFLKNELLQENPGPFLLQLTAWLELKKMGVHALLKYSDRGEYMIKRSGVLDLLSKYPKRFKL
jgi:hypothetical protein